MAVDSYCLLKVTLFVYISVNNTLDSQSCHHFPLLIIDGQYNSNLITLLVLINLFYVTALVTIDEELNTLAMTVNGNNWE